jgi:hypothetical protein
MKIVMRVQVATGQCFELQLMYTPGFAGLHLIGGLHYIFSLNSG